MRMKEDSGTARALCVLALLLLLLDHLANAEKPKDCALPKPRNVYFMSRNMRAVVHWLPPAGLGDGVLFTVQYRRYGPDSWRDMPECTNISRTWCDLTNETYDYEEQYYARVMATQNGNYCSKWACTERFNPVTDTKIDPPTVNLSSGDRYISIKLSPPEKWKRNSKDKSLFQIFSHLEFKVSIINTKTKRQWNLSAKNSSLNVTKLDPNSTYCVTVESYIPGLHKTIQPTEPQCVTTLEDNTEKLTIKILFGYVLPIVLAILLSSSVGYSVYRYIHTGEEKRPRNLLMLPVDGSNEKVFTPEINIFCSIYFVNGSNPPWNSQITDITHKATPTDKKQEVEFPQMQQPGYFPQGQEVFHVNQVDPSYNMQSQCLSGLLVTELTSAGGLLAENYGHILHMTDSVPVEGKKDQLLEEKFPVGQAYKSQTMCMLSEASRPVLHLQQDPMPLEISELTIDQSPLANCYHQRQTDASVIEEECSTTVLDWDRATGRLLIPSLLDLESKLDTEDTQKCDLCEQHSGEGLLSKLYVEQTLQKVVEDDDDEEEEALCLLQFNGKWDLHIQM